MFCTSKQDLELGAILWFQQEFPGTSKQRNWKWRSFPFHLRFGIFSPIHFQAKIPTSKQTLRCTLTNLLKQEGARRDMSYSCGGWKKRPSKRRRRKVTPWPLSGIRVPLRGTNLRTDVQINWCSRYTSWPRRHPLKNRSHQAVLQYHNLSEY
jgi:hypothetical protein